MTDEELERLQNDMYREAIEVPEEEEKELISVAHDVANKLYFHPSLKADFEYLGHQYVCQYLSVVTSNFKKIMAFHMTDLTEKKLIRAQIEVDNSLSEVENIRAVVASMLRHHTGKVDVGEINEEE